jgi:hypothetical protein
MVALDVSNNSVSPQMIKQAGSSILFGTHCDIELWDVRIRRGLTSIEPWVLSEENKNSGEDDKQIAELEPPEQLLIALTATRGNNIAPFDNSFAPKKDDILHFLIFSEMREEASAWLKENGWLQFETNETKDENATDVGQSVP